MTPNENSYFFIDSRRNRTTTPQRTSRWLNQPRDGFTALMARDQQEMSNSPEARHTSSIIVGHTGRTK